MAPSPQEIQGSAHREVSNSWNQSNLSSSPTAQFSVQSPQGSSWGGALAQRTAASGTRELKPFHTQDIKILLLENVNKSGQDILKAQGYQVEAVKTSLPEAELIEKIRSVSPTT